MIINSQVGQQTPNTPSLAIFNNKTYLAWREKSTDKLKVICSEDQGATWGAPLETGQSSKASPSLAVFGTKLYMAFSDTSNNLKVCFTLEGGRWFQANDTGRNAQAGPSMCSFNGKLYITWSGKNSNDVKVISSSDGVSWSPFTNTGRNTSHSPSISAFNGKLFITWVGINTKKIKVISSTDGQIWTPFVETGQRGNSDPSMLMTNKSLIIGFKSKDNNELRYISSNDGVNWSSSSKVNQTSAQGPSIVCHGGRLCWSFIAANSSEIQFVKTDMVEIGANQKVTLYRDSPSVHSKLHFKMYYDYQMNREILVHPDTGSPVFNLQAQDLKIGVNKELAICEETEDCTWKSSNSLNSNFEGSFIPVNANDLPLDKSGICNWDCGRSSTNHSRLTRKTSLAAISFNEASIQYPNTPCGLMGYGFTTNPAPPMNWNQLGMGYPGNLQEAFFNQIKYSTYLVAIDGAAYLRRQTGTPIGYWGLDLEVENQTILLEEVPFYVQRDVPGQDPGTRQLKLRILSNERLEPLFIPVNFDTGTPASYRLRRKKDHEHLFKQIYYFFLELAQSKQDGASEEMIKKWNRKEEKFLKVQTSLLKDDAGNFIDLPFHFENQPSVPLFSKDYYVKESNSDTTTTYFENSNKNTFGLPFFLNRAFVFKDKPENGESCTATIYKY